MIKKFTLNKHGVTHIEANVFEILTAQMQGDNLVVWINTSKASHLRSVTFLTAYTGEDAPQGYYIATVQDNNLVYHVYEIWTTKLNNY